MAHIQYYIGAVFVILLTQIRKTDVILIKKKRIPSFLSNFSIVWISVGFPVAVNNPVPASQVRFHQFRVI